MPERGRRPSDAEIREQIDATGDAGVGAADSQWPGMSYEQGVANMGMWILGEQAERPMEDE